MCENLLEALNTIWIQFMPTPFTPAVFYYIFIIFAVVVASNENATFPPGEVISSSSPSSSVFLQLPSTNRSSDYHYYGNVGGAGVNEERGHGDGVVKLGARGGNQDDKTISIPLALEASGSHFLGPVRIGGTEYQLAFSFMSSSIWILGSGAKGQTKNDGFLHKYYGKDVDVGNLLLAKYLDGSTYTGYLVEETVEIGGVNIFERRRVGIMKLKMKTIQRKDAWATRMDGVFGLGIQPMEEPNGVSAVQQMASSSSPLTSSKMSLRLKKDGKSGELRIGTNSVVPAHFSTPLTYAPVVEPLAGWTVELGAFRMGEEKLAENQPIEVNLGSNAIWAPKSVIEDIIKTTRGEATWDKTTHGVTIDCTKRDGLPTLTFEFNHVSHDFTPEEYFPEFIVPGYTMKERKCTLFMMPTESLPYGDSLSLQQRWSLGVPFFKKFYSVYDADEQAHQYRVGFALAKHA